MQNFCLVLMIISLSACQIFSPKTDEQKKASSQQHLQSVLASKYRSAEHKARDRYRHPLETLQFFDVREDMTVVEIWPAEGWYTEILAPYLKKHGTFYAAGFEKNSDIAFYTEMAEKLALKFKQQPKLYKNVIVTELRPLKKLDIAPANSADRVLTFRNVHNWMRMEGHTESVFAAMYKALKPGGILGVVEHRGDAGIDQDAYAESGYVTEAYVIQLAEQAGFKLLARSDINANPLDTKDYPEGVWALPPTLRKHTGDARYLTIGESDRMTLKFIKLE
ncbi:MAG: class I SAM-dependent methyltransferase [Gammaproteobacteria bacterium]|nr:class I SAM-dependent methyltransferase [Gammaproteobacteria bacterium]